MESHTQKAECNESEIEIKLSRKKRFATFAVASKHEMAVEPSWLYCDEWSVSKQKRAFNPLLSFSFLCAYENSEWKALEIHAAKAARPHQVDRGTRRSALHSVCIAAATGAHVRCYFPPTLLLHPLQLVCVRTLKPVFHFN